MSRLRKNLPTVPTVNHGAAHERLHYGGSMHRICRSHVTALVLLLGALLTSEQDQSQSCTIVHVRRPRQGVE